MRTIAFLVAVFWIAGAGRPAAAQFAGGSGDGFDRSILEPDYPWLSGGPGDGFGVGRHVPEFPWLAGGSADGYGSGRHTPAFPWFAGGTADGHSSGRYLVVFPWFAGGTADGAEHVVLIDEAFPAYVRVVHARIFLEGPYSWPSMSTVLRDAGHLPLSQPFADPLYDDTVLDFDSLQTLAVLPDRVVDWVLVNLRTDINPASTIQGATHAALLFEDGTVASPTRETLRFVGVDQGSYYLVIRARNHLDVMSSVALDLTDGAGAWDFSTDVLNAYGTDAMKTLSPGVWGLFAGDTNADGCVQALDFDDYIAKTLAGATGYEAADFNMDGNVQALDFDLYIANTLAGASSQVP